MPASFDALATPRRREILRLIWRGEQSAGDIHRALSDVTFGAVSQHLRVLADAGLVSARAAGRHRYYTVRHDVLGPLRPWLESMWADALYQLKVRAELDHARRGPRSRRPTGRSRRKGVRP